jgi:glycosyltransferase involved in cell wall biosynthesis
MKISIIIPTNRYGGLDITFNSLVKQTFDKEDYELIIIDDYITNRKNEYISYTKQFDVPNIVYLRSKKNYWRSNGPIANARNTGLVYAKGELIVFLDDYTAFPPKFLEEHWRVYKEGKYTLIGGGRVTKYIQEGDIENKMDIDNIDKLHSPDIEDDIEFVTIRAGICYSHIPVFMDTRILDSRISDKLEDYELEDCGGGWFYTCNASVPLEDIDLGLRLEKVGCKFCYISNFECNVIHIDHRPVDVMMKEKNLINKKYKDITYDELRKRHVIESNIDDVQLVLKEKYGTTYDGSWGLHERRRNDKTDGSFYANIVNGTKIFDLKEERRKIGL